MISVILPLYKGINYIDECIKSVINQTYSEWELLVVSEFGNDDGSAEIVKKYELIDSRIALIENDSRLGLSESLNKGITLAKGKYIARVDVDDPSYSDRFEKQVEYLENNPDVFLCGSLQRSITPNKSSVLEVPCDREELKAALIFGCEISHCSVMYRRGEWLSSGYRYNPDSLCEDYDLWTQIMFEKKLVNIPEVLVDHRWGFENISIAKGEKLIDAANEVSIRVLKQFNIDIDRRDDFLVAGWRNEPKKYAKMNQARFIRKTYEFLALLEEKNKEKGLIEEGALRKILWKRWNWACKCAGLFFRDFTYEEVVHDNVRKPVVSVVMPVYNAISTLRESIDSVILQSFQDWELILVCENENLDGSTELAKYYSKLDKRIKVIVNDKPEGLASSLNIGINRAKGKFIARLDADDLANASRLSTQVYYMENHPKIGFTQLYQHYFGQGSNGFIHRPPLHSEEIKAKLLFFCDVCHSTIMFRKEIWDEHKLEYRSEHALEDYDLWCRAINVADFATIPEIYGEYRVGGNGITSQKEEFIITDMCDTVAKQLHDNLQVDVEAEDLPLLNGWTNAFKYLEQSCKDAKLERLRVILMRVWQANKNVHYYDEKELLKVIAAKWRWSKFDISWHEVPNVNCIEDALELGKRRNIKELLEHFVIKSLKEIQNIHFHTFARNIEHLSNVTKDVSRAQNQIINETVEKWTGERYERVEKQLKIIEQQNEGIQQSLAEIAFDKHKVPYLVGEKVRIVFLYQIASMWPSWESLYKSCKDNPCVDARLVFLDETNTEKSQMIGAEKYLIESQMEYEKFDEFDLDVFSPHIIVVQTPYDGWHRQPEHWSNRFKEKGYRIVYIPYGVEISDTEDSHDLHFRQNVIVNAWRIYTFSEQMRKDYQRYCVNSKAVRALGLPRFDYYKSYDKNQLRRLFVQAEDTRKIVVWKVHFPKNIVENGKKLTVTPSLDEYIKFAKSIKKYRDYFFVFVPHPKFFENKDAEVMQKVNNIMAILSQYANVTINTDADYRNAMAVADYVIIDRSAVMVEAGALDVPVCYVSNADYYEPVPKAIEPLINSYYQVSDCQGMIDFLDMCMNGEDFRRTLRKRSFEQCIPMYDGNAGNRILTDMIDSLKKESL